VLLEEMIWAEGERLVEEHGGIALNTPAKVRALERLCALARFAQPEALTWTQTELETAFGEGRVGLMVSDTWVARSWKSIPKAPAYRALPLPSGGGQPVADLMGDGLAIFTRAREKELALAFAQMLLTSTAQKKLVEWGGLPVHEDLIAAAKDDPLLGPVLPTLRGAQGGAANVPPNALRALEYAMYLALSGRETPGGGAAEGAGGTGGVNEHDARRAARVGNGSTEAEDRPPPAVADDCCSPRKRERAGTHLR
jgi:ABC-type glycerol-3-phosphate transport system substrate-binding protein